MQFKKDPNTGLHTLTGDSGTCYLNPDNGHLMHITPGHEVIDHGNVGTIEQALEKAKQILGSE